MLEDSPFIICQLCFKEIQAVQKVKHLLDYHKIAEKAINKKEPLSRWFMQKNEEQS